MARYFITGVAGFIGSHLAERLLAEGHTVAGVDNLNDYYDVSLKEARLARFSDRIEFHKINIQDAPETVRVMKAFAPDVVVHLAAQAGVRYSIENPYTYVDSNVAGTVAVLEAAHACGNPRVVLASSSSVYGENGKVPFSETDAVSEPISVYAASKRAGELLGYTYHHLYGLDVACLRFFTVYGPFGRPDMALFKFTENILAGKPIDLYNNGDMKRDFTFVSDIVDGIVSAGERSRGYEIYNLGYGSPVALMDFVRAIEKSAGKEARINALPMQAGDVPLTYAGTEKARRMLGFAPKTAVAEGVAAFVDWYRAYYASTI
jgi:UDP-glucuronate 4-epimerase